MEGAKGGGQRPAGRSSPQCSLSSAQEPVQPSCCEPWSWLHFNNATLAVRGKGRGRRTWWEAFAGLGFAVGSSGEGGGREDHAGRGHRWPGRLSIPALLQLALQGLAHPLLVSFNSCFPRGNRGHVRAGALVSALHGCPTRGWPRQALGVNIPQHGLTEAGQGLRKECPRALGMEGQEMASAEGSG